MGKLGRMGRSQNCQHLHPLGRAHSGPLAALDALHQEHSEGKLISLPLSLFQGVNSPPLEYFPPVWLL